MSLKPLPPIPANITEKERRSHLFSPTTHHHKRKSEAMPTPTVNDAADPATSSQEPQIQAQLKTTKEPRAHPVDTFTSILSSLMFSAGLSTSKVATTESNDPSRASTPTPPIELPPDSTSATPITTSASPTATPLGNITQSLDTPNVVSLDQRSFQHLRAIARQSIASSCLEPEILWLRLFMDVMQKIAANASDAWVRIEAAHAAAHRSQCENNRLERARTTDTNNKKAVKDKDDEKEKNMSKGNGKENEKESGGTKPTFSYSICLKKHISTTQECIFTPGKFEGESILLEERSIIERRRPPMEGQPRIALGGTITLSASADDLSKVERILELLVFALCSLQLEAYLMRDHDVVRPEHSLNIDTDTKFGKASLSSQQNTFSSLKRSSKGSGFFGWLSRGTLPAKYKRGTTQLALDVDVKPKQRRLDQTSTDTSLAEDFGMTEDIQNFQSYQFAKIIQQLEKAIISVSPDISFPPPHLLLRLRDEEAVGSNSKTKSYTWEDVEFVAKKIGFGNRMNRSNARSGTIMRHSMKKGDSAKRTRLPIDSRAGLEHLMTNLNSLQGIFNHQSISFSYSYYWSATAAAPCNPPNMITVEYYRKEGEYEDMSLGEMIEHICKRVNSNCLDKTCGHKRLEHISSYTHGEARVNITVEQLSVDSARDSDLKDVSPATGSKAKELISTTDFKAEEPTQATDFDSWDFEPFLSDNNTMAVWTRCKICKSRTKPNALSRASRLYSFGKYLELLFYARHFEPGPRPLCEHIVNKDATVRCFLYRQLVVNFEHESIDLFEMRISRLQVHEDFPPMPRYEPGDMDDDRRGYSITSSFSMGHPPRINTVPTVSTSLTSIDYFTEKEQANLLDQTRLEILRFYESCKKIIVMMEQHLGETKSISKRPKNTAQKMDSAASGVIDPVKKVALKTLDEFGDQWKQDEFDLYNQLKYISIPQLNDTRNRFKDCIKRTMRSMEAWQKEHHPESLANLEKESVNWVLPEYYISSDYLTLVSSIINHECNPADTEDEKAPQPPQKDYHFRTLTIPMRTPLKTSRSDGSVTLVGRKTGSNGSEASTTGNSVTNGSINKEILHSQGEENDEDDECEEDSFLVVDGYETSVRFLHVPKVDFTSLIPSGTMSPRSTIGLHFGSSRHNKTSTSVLGAGLADNKKGDSTSTIIRPFSMMALPSSTPALVSSLLASPGEKPTASSFFGSPSESQPTTPNPGSKFKGSLGYRTLTSGLSGTMKGLSLNSLSDKLGSGFAGYNGSDEKNERDTLKTDPTEKTIKETLAIERELESTTKSPHLKAPEFDTLRRRCGIHQTYVQSLSRCTSWSANGGKSKSSFYKTKDDRFVIKQMVSSWNIAEKDELLKFAPKYFEYMEKPHDAPTVLAKIFGFYTLKIKSRDSGQVLRIDVLVMEHLFYNQKITRTFDLKGIQDRHAGSKINAGNNASTTLWDGDFIEGRYKTLLLLYSHSKKIIRESLLNDTEFLAGANIMDYSLLVGVDDERKELVVGIVDFIGAYTWYKKIESKGKTTLRGAKDSVTVLPPQQYKTRFREAMERYFLAIPDKWSKTVIEQEQEAKKEATNASIPTTVPEGPKGSALDTSDSEQPLKDKTSGYLEKMSKAILPTSTKPSDTMASIASTTFASEHHDNKLTRILNTVEQSYNDSELRVGKLPRVFHPLD
ncbi:hypothetical protein BX616_003396 [Lobosporangium transversale]|nr:hypothetical protein BX616_003396 [Lobosporangium transversale]